MTDWKICISILSNDTQEAIKKIKMAEKVADLLEIRLDSMSSFMLDSIIGQMKLPILITYRDPEEGGFRKEIKDTERVRVLKEAIELGAEYVDIELEMPEQLREQILKKKGNTEIIISKHFFEPVPEKLLFEYAEKIFESGADIAKLIGYAETWKDNLIFLRLVEEFNKKGHKLISFAMGPYGGPSRIMSPILGAPWTYAALTKGEKAAPGQIEASSLRQIWKEISRED